MFGSFVLRWTTGKNFFKNGSIDVTPPTHNTNDTWFVFKIYMTKKLLVNFLTFNLFLWLASAYHTPTCTQTCMWFGCFTKVCQKLPWLKNPLSLFLCERERAKRMNQIQETNNTWNANIVAEHETPGGSHDTRNDDNRCNLGFKLRTTGPGRRESSASHDKEN